ncbi:MAG: hypothetical protein U0835_01630 [Isosphaeraceae bacterium]
MIGDGGADAGSNSTADRTSPTAGLPLLDSLVTLYRDNEALLAELKALSGKIARARAYLLSEGCHRAFGESLLLHLHDRRIAVRAALRANRVRALDLAALADRRHGAA